MKKICASLISIFILVISLASCGQASTVHEHTFATTYSYNEEGHYQKSLCNHPETEKIENHIFSKEPTLTVDATYDRNGFKRFKCSVCDYYYDEPLEKLPKENITGLVLSSKSFVYDGQEHSLELEGSLPKGVTVTYTGNNQTEPGTYTVTAHFTSKSTKYNVPEDITATLTIVKASIYGVALADARYTYDGKPHSLNIVGSLPKGVTVTYTGNNQTNAGEYTVTATLVDPNGHYDVETTLSAKLIIDKAQVSSRLSKKNFIYDGQPHSLTLNIDLPEGVTVEYTGNDNVNVGEYTVTAHFADSTGNYIVPEDMTATYIIYPFPLSDKNIKFTNKAEVYDGQPHSLTVDGELPSGVTVEYSQNDFIYPGIYNVVAHFVSTNDNFIAPNDMSAYLTILTTNENAKIISSSIIEFGGSYYGVSYKDNIGHYSIGYSENNFSFANSITVTEGATYKVYDETGSQITLDSISLNPDEIKNIVIIVTKGDDQSRYEVEIERFGLLQPYFGDRTKVYCINDKNVTEVTVPEGVTYIATKAFYGCSKLTKVVLPSTLVTIEKYAFYNCTSLQEIAIPNTVTTIADSLFYRCTNLKNISMSNAITAVGKSAFYECRSLTELSFTDSLLTIGDYAFYGCYNLLKLNLGNNVKTIGDYAFFACNSLYDLTYSDKLETIGKKSFNYCIQLTSITIPKTVTSIGEDAFLECIKLSEIINLSSLSLSESVLSYKTNGTSNIVKVGDYYFITANGTNTLINYIGNEKILTLPEGYNGKAYEIGSYAFASYHYEGYNNRESLGQLVSITVPSKVTKIKGGAFGYNPYLVSVIIGNDVMEVGDDVFINDGNLLSITIGSSVKKMGSISSKCTKLAEIINLSTVVLSNNDISRLVTYKTSGPTSLCYQDGLYYIVNDDKMYVLEYDGEDDVVNIGSDSMEVIINNYAFYANDIIREVNLGKNVITIGKYAFGRSSVEKVTMTDSVVSLGSDAFYRSEKLKTVKLSNNIEAIEVETFCYCESLLELVIPDSVKTIGYRAFECCYNLLSITMPSTATVASHAFYDDNKRCETLTSEMESHLVYVDDFVFYYEEGETPLLVNYIGNDVVVYLPESFNGLDYEIRDYAFSNLIGANVSTIVAKNSISKINQNTFAQFYRYVVIDTKVTSIDASSYRVYYFMGTKEEYESVERTYSSNVTLRFYSEECKSGYWHFSDIGTVYEYI